MADLGCGPGHVTTFLRSLGVDAVGLDVSARMVSIARRRSPANPVIQGSMAALPWPPASLDGALIRYSMIHAAVDEMPHLLAEVARGLRPGGHLLLFFLGVEDVEEDGRSYEHRVATAHLRHPSVVDRHLGEVGLTPVAWWRQGPGPTRPFSPCATMAVRATVATPDEPAAVAQ
ncbi:MAG: class I SAM-dependent methyltransferase [Actinomycetota bacterium]